MIINGSTKKEDKNQMPHSIDINSLSERVFILHNMCHASLSICSKYKIGRFVEDAEEYEWNDYFGWLKVFVCESMIHLAIRLRILEDSVKSDEQEINWGEIDQDSRKDLCLGKYHKGNDKITIREICNKIIHATDISLDWTSIDKENENDGSPEYWTGVAWLFGKKGNKEWKLELNVEALCIALRRYIEALENTINWDGLYKYDE